MYHGLTERSGRFFFPFRARFPFDDCLNRLPLPGAAWPVFDLISTRNVGRAIGMEIGEEGCWEENVENFKQARTLVHTMPTETRYLRKTRTKRPALCQPYTHMHTHVGDD